MLSECDLPNLIHVVISLVWIFFEALAQVEVLDAKGVPVFSIAPSMISRHHVERLL